MLRQYPGLLRKVALLAELVTTVLSFVLAHYFRLLLLAIYPFGEPAVLANFRLLLVIIVAIWAVLFTLQGRYIGLRYTSLWTECQVAARIVVLGGLLLPIVLFLLKLSLFPRSLFVLFLLINLLGLCLERVLLHWFLRWLRRRGHDRKTVLVVGGGKRAWQFIEATQQRADWGLDIVGFIDQSAESLAEEFDGARFLGTTEETAAILHRHPVDEVIIALPVQAIQEIRRILALCKEEGVQARVVSDLFSVDGAKIRVDRIHDIPILTFSTGPTQEWQLLAKRAIDVVASAILLVLLAPLFLIIAVAIKLTSPGPVFYEWKVMGLNKKPFSGYKFRTMVQNADELKAQLVAANEMSGPVFKIKNDPRVTPVGRILRKFSLDELPQLWSVLKGDMSLVGPRPPLVTEVNRFERWQRRKLSIRPGITCLWQVNGRSQITNFDEWARLDLEYIDNWSLGLDFKILLRTIPVVLLGRGAH
jgi:exopolysaccharide biosynthesis polyprenyl glycosylphosphotransferase